MAQPYVGEIRLFAGSFPPNGWMFCDGQPIAIAENETLFQLIGTTYGGDGEETFNLPDLRGRVPIHQGTGYDGITYTMGEPAGVESVTLTVQQIPAHNHTLVVSGDVASSANPANQVLGASRPMRLYQETTPYEHLNAGSVSPAGGSQPHDNFQPYLCINFIISMSGIFPNPS
jgi:microcystin-dependent protein